MQKINVEDQHYIYFLGHFYLLLWDFSNVKYGPELKKKTLRNTEVAKCKETKTKINKQNNSENFPN